mmetsp:Transcript_82576/g.123925  ORF Transcript_82576/g.123925 Transcript_82576/m.123925 type:complete len:329 (-) Transcript_82576:982-1968(-)
MQQPPDFQILPHKEKKKYFQILVKFPLHSSQPNSPQQKKRKLSETTATTKQKEIKVLKEKILSDCERIELLEKNIASDKEKFESTVKHLRASIESLNTENESMQKEIENLNDELDSMDDERINSGASSLLEKVCAIRNCWNNPADVEEKANGGTILKRNVRYYLVKNILFRGQDQDQDLINLRVNRSNPFFLGCNIPQEFWGTTKRLIEQKKLLEGILRNMDWTLERKDVIQLLQSIDSVIKVEEFAALSTDIKNRKRLLKAFFDVFQYFPGRAKIEAKLKKKITKPSATPNKKRLLRVVRYQRLVRKIPIFNIASKGSGWNPFSSNN